MSDDAVRARVLSRRLHRVHRGVYAVGHAALSSEGRCTAAVLAVGGRPARGESVLAHWGAAVGHRSAAVLWGRPGAISGWELRKAIRQANVIGLPLGDEDAAERTRSDLEGDFLAICRRHQIPRPEVNVLIGSFLVDFLWREERLVVETDSYRYHRGEVAFQDDHARELELMRCGFDVLRLSEVQIDEAPKDVAEVLGAELRKRRAPN